MDEQHDMVVKTNLTESEFLAFKSICADAGLSQSAAIRQMVKQLIRSHVAADCSRRAGFDARTEMDRQ